MYVFEKALNEYFLATQINESKGLGVGEFNQLFEDDKAKPIMR